MRHHEREVRDEQLQVDVIAVTCEAEGFVKPEGRDKVEADALQSGLALDNDATRKRLPVVLFMQQDFDNLIATAQVWSHGGLEKEEAGPVNFIEN
jgi:hypothetical protein